MRTIEQTIFNYSELEDSAKERAREWFSSGKRKRFNADWLLP
ncbi:hypothetical protein UFOVP7_10 [uncultured Caudovirales phage]|uniref:Uncharacterized protein n=1 Tax=uncultured Caudovirales phage TaxID=2100421 RepID=A0A6J5KIN1_9CAUD|nr:hypothetical protein UFOVP7_10 [uncultured Caudovirales phage]